MYQTIILADDGGVIHRYPDFASQFVAARHVDVWLPPNYAPTNDARLPVIYMHDGKNLFDPTIANTGVDWGVDEAVTRLTQAGVIAGAIVVGVWHSDTRWRDYMPQKPVEQAAAALLAPFIAQNGGPPQSDAYLRFLVTEVKPFIDAAYRTRPGQPHTFIMGSSMGGLVSLYALSEYPRIFGGAGCLSTHWPAGGAALVTQMAAAVPAPGQHRLYFDYGTEGLDANYEPFQQQMDARLRRMGYQFGEDWLTRKFSGADHSETAWQARVEIPLRFLLSGDWTNFTRSMAIFTRANWSNLA
ncbi:MAG: alpha/beta hydrolase [Ardenticatenales bacterium]|nr:alpha/beta hydrolase [Ardenticatenales bacterium]